MITIPEALVYSLLGFVIVFFGLILLMLVIWVMAKVMGGDKKQAAPVAAAPVQAAPVARGSAAPGSAGEVKLFDVPDKQAAMIMAIVADQMKKPLNELRFKSIKEVK